MSGDEVGLVEVDKRAKGVVVEICNATKRLARGRGCGLKAGVDKFES